MPVRPTSASNWATGTIQVEEPSVGKKDTGWDGDAAEVPTARHFNWLFKNLDEWRDHLANGYDTLEQLTQSLPFGSSYWVQPEGDFTLPWLDPIVTRQKDAFGDATPDAIAADGRFVFVSDLDEVVTLDRTALTELSRTSAGAHAHIFSDGVHLFVAGSLAENWVKCYPINDDGSLGTVLWTYDHDDRVKDVYSDGNRCFFVGDRNPSNEHGGALFITGASAGLADWTFDLGANTSEALCIISDGVSVYVGAFEDTGTSDDFYLIDYATGAITIAYDHGAGRDCMAVALGRRSVFCGLENGDVVSRWKANPGSLHWTASGVLTIVTRLAMCYDYLAVAGGNGGFGTTTVALIDPDPNGTGRQVATYDHDLVQGGGSDVIINAIASDGLGLYSCGSEDDAAATGDTVWRHNLLRGAHMVTVIDGDNGRYRHQPTHIRAFITDLPFGG